MALDPEVVVDGAPREPREGIARLAAIPAVRRGAVLRLDERRPPAPRPAHGPRPRGALPRAPPGGAAVSLPRAARLALALAAGAWSRSRSRWPLSCALGAQPISLRAALRGRRPRRRHPRSACGCRAPCWRRSSAAPSPPRAPRSRRCSATRSPSRSCSASRAAPRWAARSCSSRRRGVARVAGAAGEALGARRRSRPARWPARWPRPCSSSGSAAIGGRLVPEAALLVGIVFNAFVAGVITLIKMLVPPEQASRLLYWLLGAVGYESPGHASRSGAVLVALSVGALVALSARLNLLTLGDEEAASLGARRPARSRGRLLRRERRDRRRGGARRDGRVRRPHRPAPRAARGRPRPPPAASPPRRSSAPPSWSLADALARLAFLPLGTEPPVGAVTAFLGGPFFLWLLRRSARP